MKKVLILIMALIMVLGMIGCSTAETTPGESLEAEKKTSEAIKCEELICAIGEISLENESAFLAAQAYYNTLTDEQKAQVENIGN